MRAIVTGSTGLIGSDVARYLLNEGWTVLGIDNNARKDFFGEGGDTSWQKRDLKSQADYRHSEDDIRDREAMMVLHQQFEPDAIVHAAAQPSHDLASDIPFANFDVNATGTVNLLEALRRYAREAPFVFLSTNKVYGDRPNQLPLSELETRYEFAGERYRRGISEELSIDQSMHSLFGASKVAADIMVQEYGRYFNLKTCCLRGGCLTGPTHSGVELHGFLSYLVRCNLTGEEYTVFGYNGKQVRDNIHSADVARLVDRFIEDPRPGEVYNIGGGWENSCSIVEAISAIEDITGRDMNYSLSGEARQGDHICYYSDLSKAQSHYPGWEVEIGLRSILEEIARAWEDRL